MQASAIIDSKNYQKREGRAHTELDDFLDLVRTRPDAVALASYLTGVSEPAMLTYRKMGELVDKLAVRLLEFGVKPREVISYQFPNRWEFAIAHLATIRVGAITNALMPIYGRREMRFMIERTQSRVCIALARTAKSEPGRMLAEIRDELDCLQHIILIDDDSPAGSLEAQLTAVQVDDAARARLDELRPKPDSIQAILFSSGTTGEPKGVLHSFNSNYRATSNSFRVMGMSSDDVVMMFSPLGHATGFDYGLLMPLFLGCKMVYQESWDPLEMLRIVEKEGVTWTMGSAAFAKDACDAAENMPADKRYDTSSLRCFVSGGAPIPPKLIGRTTAILGAQLIPCWGSTEVGIATVGRLTDTEEKRASSDGAPVDGVALRAVDDNGNVVPPHVVGHLQLRASGQHVGYYMNDQLYADSYQGDWFKTGDLGKIDEDGYVRIAGRFKDLVIRGGENIPIIEIENLILEIPAVAEVCIVGVPDDRLGERCHAVVVPREPGAPLSLRDLTIYLEKQDVTKQYWPELMSIASDLPRTSSGKIQRFLVRDSIIEHGKMQ